jgi:hypothetical protein
MMPHPLVHLFISWLPIVIIYGIWIWYAKKGLARQQQVLTLLTEIRDRLPPAT